MKTRFSALLVSIMTSCLAGAAWSSVVYVQVGFSTTPGGTGNTQVAVTMPSATTAGNLLAVGIGWNDTTSSIAAVTDSRGNTFSPAFSSITRNTTTGEPLSQTVYYSSGIAGGPDTITVTFNTTPTFPDVRVLEFSGVSALDKVSVGTGSGTSASSGNITTTSANEALAAFTTTFTAVKNPGTNFTRVTMELGDDSEYEVVSSTGTYHDDPTLNPSGSWITSLASFKGTAGAISVRIFGTGSVTSVPAGINCTSGTCSANFVPGTSVTLTATPGTGFAFSNWSGACSNVAAGTKTCTITASGSQSASAVFTNSKFVYPLKVSSNSRYIVDQHNQTFLLVGDSPQALIGNVSEGDAETYFAARQALQFNAAWVNLLCDSYTGCNPNGTTFDGIAPFTTGSDPSTYRLTKPNPSYFQRVDDMINLAAEYGIVVFLDPIETGGWMTTLKNNGAKRDRAYGNYLAQRYRNFPNIVWFLGNDFGNYNTDTTGNTDLQAVSQGLNDYDTLHLQTGEFAQPGSTLDNTLLAPLMSLDGAYTYMPTYAQVLHNYNRSGFKPAFLEEANYEGGHNCTGSTTDGSLFHLRHQEYWTMTSGATGYLTGNDTYITYFSPGWQDNLQTAGMVQFSYWQRFFNAIPLWNLVPDQNHALVIAGYGTYSTSPCTTTFTNNYVTAAITSDKKTAVIYFPESATITVNMAQFPGSVTAIWFDPSNGTETTVSGSPFANSGTRNFMPSGNNSAGDPDWALRLTTP